jgi:hypothetical protein
MHVGYTCMYERRPRQGKARGWTQKQKLNTAKDRLSRVPLVKRKEVQKRRKKKEELQKSPWKSNWLGGKEQLAIVPVQHP